MDSLIVPTSPETSIRGGVIAATTTNTNAELWEVILVASCPIIFIIFLCLCVVCLVVRGYDRPGIPVVQTVRQSTPIASILRQLPPPPKYDIAVLSVDAPPPIYTEDDIPPTNRYQSTDHDQLIGRTTGMQPLSIQYLYPPKYEANESDNNGSSSSRVEHVVVDMDGGRH